MESIHVTIDFLHIELNRDERTIHLVFADRNTCVTPPWVFAGRLVVPTRSVTIVRLADNLPGMAADLGAAPGWGAGVVEEEIYGVAADGGEGVGQPPIAGVDAVGEVVRAEESDGAALQGMGGQLAANGPA